MRRGCCYPHTRKPASEFSIHGLWPNYNDEECPQFWFCGSSREFDYSKVLITLYLSMHGIKPDGREYSLRNIKEAIKESTGQLPRIECNRSEQGEHQLYQLYVCVDKWDAFTIIGCPFYAHSNCPSMLVFPPFWDNDHKIQEAFTSENNTNGT
eukprot:PITA_17450